MPITRTPIVDDDGTGTTGTVLDNAWKTELYNQIDSLSGAAGNWTDVAFNVANFWPGVAAGQVTVNRYSVVGKTLTWIVVVAGAPGPSPASPYCYFTLPAGLTMVTVMSPVAHSYDGIDQTHRSYCDFGSPSAIAVKKSIAGNNWTAPVYIQFTAIVALL